MIKCINPSTEEVIGEFEETPLEEIDYLVKRSKLAQEKWFALSKEKRIEILKKVKEGFEKSKEEIVDTIHEEGGFDKDDINDTLLDVLDGFDHYIAIYKNKKDIDFPINQEVFPESDCEIKFYPHGVIAQIGVWNYPLWQTMITAIPALLTGNSILYKPSGKATKIGVLISDIIKSIVPEDVFILIVGSSEQGRYLVKSDVDAIVYTGNMDTGREIIQNAGVKPLILELSGNDAAIICKDCDMEQTISGVVSGAFLHSGEVCDRIKRIYIVKDIAQEFIQKAVNKIETIKDRITPVIREEALEKIHKQVKKTVEDGAVIFSGGKVLDRKGFYYEPTLLKLENNEVEAVRTEIFGPVVSLLVVENEEEALKYANATKFGLGTSVWTQDIEKAKRIADKTKCGIVWINDSNIPLVCGEYFKGWKNTGIPNASDRLSMFMKSKTVISFNSKGKRSWWF